MSIHGPQRGAGTILKHRTMASAALAMVCVLTALAVLPGRFAYGQAQDMPSSQSPDIDPDVSSLDSLFEQAVEPGFGPGADPETLPEQGIDQGMMPGQVMPDADPGPVIVPLPAPEVNTDPFRVKDIPVDVTAANAVAARERGLLQGRLAAFNALIERIVPADARAFMPTPTQTQIIDMVQEFSVGNERSSAVRYLADLDVKFNPIAVRSFLGDAQVPFTEIYSRPLVVVSVLQTDPFSPPTLWSDPDPWADAWASLLPREGLVPLVMPLADITDFGLLSLDQVQFRDVAALQRFADRYQAGGVLIATAARSIEAPDAFQISLMELRASGATFETSVPVAGQGAATVEDSLAAAAKAAVEQVEDAWKRRNMVQAGVGGEVVAMADVTGLSDWLKIKTQIEQVPLVSRVDLQAMTRTRIQLAITHAGTVEQLRSALALQSLELQDVDGLWTVVPARPTVIGGTPGYELPEAIAVP